ncbi:hypothetical protein MMC16_002639 [Acarospora aff. strigata]|nr:hypothetical protein [Acarospora aff. strigata]
MSAASISSGPCNYDMVPFPGFQALDVFGPLDALNLLSLRQPMTLSLIASTLDPVSTKPISAPMNPHTSNFSQSVVPTHTFAAPPPSLDVLIVPGGLGTRAPAPALADLIAFIKDSYPTLQHLITVCTGAGLAARAGVLDGKRATTNKAAWNATTALGPNVEWVPRARWVRDGNVWTSAGVSAGIDVTLAFVAEVVGTETAAAVANTMEYERHVDPSWDPFAELYHLGE